MSERGKARCRERERERGGERRKMRVYNIERERGRRKMKVLSLVDDGSRCFNPVFFTLFDLV
jgi:hypothetical protein